MKKHFFVIFAIIFCNLAIHSQSKYGNTTMDEMNMTVYPQDTTANAVILLKSATLDFVYNDIIHDFQYEYTLSVKIKILKQEGLDEANQEIFYTKIRKGSEEDIRSLSGTTYNLENGKITKTKLSKEHIFDSSVNNRHFQKKFTMPAAKVGSVLEYKYTIVSDFYYEMRDFDFQESIPIQNVSYCVTIPEWFHYNTNMRGYESVQTKITPKNMTLNVGFNNLPCLAEEQLFTIQNVPALKPEGYVWNIDDYRSKVSFELKSTTFPRTTIKYYSSTWANIGKKLWEDSDYGGQTKKGGLFKDEIEKQETNKENALKILSLIKSKVKWNEQNRFSPNDNLKKILKDGIGNSSDINFLYINALKTAGFEAYPVMLSTRDNGRLPITSPTLTLLNNTITAIKIDTMMYYTDASDKYGSLNILPNKCMVDQALILKENEVKWVNLSNITRGTTFIRGTFKYNDNKLSGDIIVERKSQDAYTFKSHYNENYKSEEEYLEKLSADLNYEISNFTLNNNDIHSDENIISKYTVSKDASLDEEFLYINPLLIRLFNENPFHSEKRLYPVQFNNISNFIEMIDIEIPEGYVVEELPASERYLLGHDKSLIYTYITSQTGNKISINYQFQIKSLLMLPEEYEPLKELFAKIVAKNGSQIVLKKAV